MLEQQSGYVSISGQQKSATILTVGDRLELQVIDAEGSFEPVSSAEHDLVQFRGSRNGFTLLDLQHKRSQARPGVGGITIYSVRLALEDVLYETLDQILSQKWTVYIEDLGKIVPVTGLQQTIAFNESGGMAIAWAYKSAPAVVLSCPKAGLELRIGQEMRTGGDALAGPSMTFRYPATIILNEDLKLFPALTTISRIRLFFSLVMGRVLGIDELALRLEDDAGIHHARIHGLLAVQRSLEPAARIMEDASPDDLGAMLDEWLVNFDELQEAIHLHMDGLEQQKLPLQLRFQIFAQALEALHRKTSVVCAEKIDVKAVKAALNQLAVSREVVDRVGGMIAHAHEPGLRQRLKSYWDEFAPELAVLRPAEKRNKFVDRVVATRNHFAHRMDRDALVLEGADLWDHTETIKAISHMAILQAIGGKTDGAGQNMLERRFTKYVIRRER